jgi:hypothetical protein
MSSSEPDVPIFAAMLRGALGDRVSESATFPAMLAENVEIEHPLRPTARSAYSEGRPWSRICAMSSRDLQ